MTRRERYNELAVKTRSVGEEGEYSDLKLELEAGGKFLDEDHAPEPELTASIKAKKK